MQSYLTGICRCKVVETSLPQSRLDYTCHTNEKRENKLTKQQGEQALAGWMDGRAIGTISIANGLGHAPVSQRHTLYI